MASSGWAKNSTKTINTWCNRHSGGHDVPHIVDTSGRLLVWCRKSSGSEEFMREVEENKKNNLLKMIQKLEEGQMPGGKDEGNKMLVTRTLFKRSKEEFHDASFMAPRGMWHLME